MLAPKAYLIVGIGASAGGLAALEAFFDGAPDAPGMAFVVIQHLDPSTESRSAEILAGHTKMPVVQISDGMRVEPDHVYVIAPDKAITIEDGVLRARKRTEPAGRHHPIDEFFRSLAADQQERSAAIILSGTGANGSSALADIKAQGGVVFAQEPETAEFDAMPRNAIETGHVDKALAPAAMAAALVDYVRGLGQAQPAPGESADDDDEAGDARTGGNGLAPIRALLRRRSKLSIEDYKPNMVARRIRRRMGLAGIESEGEYADYLRTNPLELDKLASDLLILVTEFFRDEEAWDLLAGKIIAPLIAERPADRPIRAWAAGAAAGHEAYSLAMLLTEAAESAGVDGDFEIFVTDISEKAVAKARDGRYAPAEVERVPEARLKRFFEREDDHYRIKPELRERMVFSPHDLIRDPPFSNLDIVVCRNLLIYLTPETQNRIIPLMHFALKSGGCLFLGSAEHLGRHENLFQTVSKKWRIYRREGAARHDLTSFPTRSGKTRAGSEPAAAADGPLPARLASSREKISQFAAQALAARYAPACVLIDRDMNVVFYHGATERYLTQRTGEPTRNLLLLADDPVAMRVRRMIPKALESKDGETAAVRLLTDNEMREVRLTVAPLRDRGDGDLLMVAFEETKPSPSAGRQEVAEAAASEDLAAENRALREELRALMDGSAEDRETLKASNEEVVSMNEELRATNEELESSKEELQSLNEELETLNRQLRSKVSELQKRTDDLNNLLSANDIATLFLDRDLKIAWFTPAIKSLMNLVAGDIGRAVSDFLPKFRDEAFFEDAGRVISTLIPAEREVCAEDGRWRLRRMIPYRTGEDRISGLVVTFIDITDRRRHEQEVLDAKVYAETIVETVREPLIVLDADLNVLSANAAFYRDFRVRPEETEGERIYDLGNGQWNIPKLRRLLEDLLAENHNFEGFEVTHDFEGIGEKTMLLNARRIDGEDHILLAIEDVTALTRHIREQRQLLDELNHRVKNTLMTVQAIATLSLSGDGSLDEARRSFTARLHALSRTHSALSNEDWRSMRLDAVLAQALEPYGYTPGNGGRIHLSGPDVSLPSKKAQTFAMAFHELATNAAKYGALSDKEGTVAVSWTSNGQAETPFSLTWIESDGPCVSTPARTGFGTAMTTQLLAGEIGGRVTIDYPSTGLICRMSGRL